MGRAIQAEIDRLGAEVAVMRLAEARGVVLRAEGGELRGRCPFHPDPGQTLAVDLATNAWRCAAGCGAGGPVEWVMVAEGISKRHAVELLRAGMAPASNGTPPRHGSVRRLAAPLEARASDAELLGQVAAFYAQTLTSSPDALGWLASQGVRDPAALDAFGLGFADRTLGYRLPERNRKAGAELRGRLQALGILRASGHEHLRGCVTVPVRDETGHLTQLYGRRVGRAREDRGGATDLWLPGEGHGVWNRDALVSSGEVIVCASPLDALVWWSAGLRHVIACDPASIDELLDALGRHDVDRVLVAFGRPAGDRAAATLATRLDALGIGCFRVVLPRGVDVTEIAADAGGAAADVLGRLVRAATWIGVGTGPARRQRPMSSRRPEPPRPAEPDPAPPAGPAVVEPASVSPLPAAPQLEVSMDGAELRAVAGDRRWRVRGLERVSSFDVLRLNVAVGREDPELGELFHVDTLDLYSARARAAFVHAAAGEVRVAEEVMRRDLGRLLLSCEERAAEAIRAAQAPADTTVELSCEERAAALELLRDPDLIGRIVADVARAGIVGETTNALVGYLAAVSRKLDTPLAVLVQSMSAAGKSSLIDAVLALVPAEDRVRYSAMTGQALYYLGETDLAHRVLAVAEEEGATRAAYALKLLQSDGELSIASTGKDTASGRLTTQTYRVAGPVALFLTTTAAELDEELANRCLVLTVDEERDQTRAIHAAQRARQTLDGLVAAAERRRVIKLHQDAQRLLEPVAVVNPFAPQLGFADERTRTRRDHVKYLTLIRAIALLHQHQRPRRRVTHDGIELAYIEVTRDDIALANRLAHEVLGRSLDELAPQTRRLLELVDKLVAERCIDVAVTRADVRFSRREVRAFTGWSDFQVRVHLGRLVSMEYVIVHRGGRGQSFVYELAWDGGGTDGRPHLIGLTDPAALSSCDYRTNLEHANTEVEGSSSPGRGPVEGTSSSNGNGHRPARAARVDDVESDARVSGSTGHRAIAAEDDD